MSNGAAVWAAIQIAEDLSPSETVVTLLPDRGDRHLSTNLFRSMCADCPPLSSGRLFASRLRVRVRIKEITFFTG